ncbi:hypothetical protein ACEQPO_06160 [Bacillus sp. SL00103]
MAMAAATRLVKKRNSYWHHFNGIKRLLGFRRSNRDISKQSDRMESIIRVLIGLITLIPLIVVYRRILYERTRTGDDSYAVIDFKR